MDTKQNLESLKSLGNLDEHSFTIWEIIASLIPSYSSSSYSSPNWIYNDILLIGLWYIQFIVAPLLLPVPPQESLTQMSFGTLLMLVGRHTASFLLVFFSNAIPWYLQTPLFRALYGLLSIIHTLRLIQLRNALWNKNINSTNDNRIIGTTTTTTTSSIIPHNHHHNNMINNNNNNNNMNIDTITNATASATNTIINTNNAIITTTTTNITGTINTINNDTLLVTEKMIEINTPLSPEHNERLLGKYIPNHNHDYNNNNNIIIPNIIDNNNNNNITRSNNLLSTSSSLPTLTTFYPIDEEFFSKPRKYALLLRVAFVYYFHDLRMVYPRHRNYLFLELLRNLSLNLSIICLVSILSTLVSVEWIYSSYYPLFGGIGIHHITTIDASTANRGYDASAYLTAKYVYLIWVLVIHGIYLICTIYCIDCFYRMLLLPFHLDVPSTMQSPHLSLSVQEFWGRRFNVVIQSLLKQFIFDPCYHYLYYWNADPPSSNPSDKDKFNMSTRLLIEYKIENVICCRNDTTKRYCQFSKRTSFYIASLATFMASALLHFYPLFLIIKDAPFFVKNPTRDFGSAACIVTGFSLMTLYFIIQWACIIIEQHLKITTNASKSIVRLWVFGYILLLSPLFVVPFLLTFRLYQ